MNFYFFQVEFVGGPMCWNTRLFSATAGGGAFCNGQRIQVSATNQVERSLLVTGFGYDHDDAWATNIDLFKEFTDVSRGVRRLGAAAVDMCHVALGIVEAYWEYRLKPWDMAAGVLVWFMSFTSLIIILTIVDLTLLPDEQILNGNQPDMDDFLPSENQDEEATAMVEESPSGDGISDITCGMEIKHSSLVTAPNQLLGD
ncbi:phosphatase IMPL1, chloroplastic-like [Cajanus cajan]|uniref:phosphatase IMPL1, chloroplastic-like n=1 Tax=Cajanus cajan TaxID=3821 RepID=UPI00098DAD48|nr:phosphatase IMPL1, chloroplastic-like [Cajanus cajan]